MAAESLRALLRIVIALALTCGLALSPARASGACATIEVAAHATSIAALVASADHVHDEDEGHRTPSHNAADHSHDCPCPVETNLSLGADPATDWHARRLHRLELVAAFRLDRPPRAAAAG